MKMGMRGGYRLRVVWVLWMGIWKGEKNLGVEGNEGDIEEGGM